MSKKRAKIPIYTIDVGSSIGILETFCNRLRLDLSLKLLENLESQASVGKIYRNTVLDLKQTIAEEMPGLWGSFLLQCYHEAGKLFDFCNEKKIVLKPTVPELKGSSILAMASNPLNTRPGEMSAEGLDKTALVLIGYCFTIVSERCPGIAKDERYNDPISCCSDFRCKGLSPIDNIRHAFEHADVYLTEDGGIRLRNARKDIETEVDRHRLVEESIRSLELISDDLGCDEDIRSIIHDILPDMERIRDADLPVTYKPMMMTMMMFYTGIEETYGTQVYRIYESIREQVGYPIGEVQEHVKLLMGHDPHELRNSFAHADIEFRGQHLIIRNEDHEPIDVMDVMELAVALKHMQLMYKLPILTGCLAILECNSEEHRMEFNIDPGSARIVSVGGPGDCRDRPERRGRPPAPSQTTRRDGMGTSTPIMTR